MPPISGIGYNQSLTAMPGILHIFTMRITRSTLCVTGAGLLLATVGATALSKSATAQIVQGHQSLGAGAARAKTAEQAEKYRSCMALARRRPQDGFETAIAWRSLGGGDAADHCAAVALIELQQYDEAARRLERLAGTSLEEPDIKAGLFEQAGQAWLLSGRAENATRAFTSAIGLKPGDADLLADRAQAWAARNDYEAADADLSAALNLSPSRDDIYALRASARRFLDRPDDALADANTALELNPNNPEALLERGILRRLAGDDAGARADWLKILNGMPDSDAAGPARQNIENMDVKPEGPPPRR